MNRSRKYGGEHLLGGTANLDLLGGQVFALRRLHQIEGAHLDPLLVRKAQRCPCRRADRIVGHGLRRAGHFELDVGLLHRKSPDPSGQAPRSAEGLDGGIRGKVLGGQQLLQIEAKILLGLRQHSRRDLLAPNLKQEFDGTELRGRLHACTSLARSEPFRCSR